MVYTGTHSAIVYTCTCRRTMCHALPLWPHGQKFCTHADVTLPGYIHDGIGGIIMMTL